MAEVLTHEPLEIGLVNNMPDSALKAAERQFGDLLKEAAANVEVRLRYFYLPGLPRGEAALMHMANYRSTECLWDTPLDGLIVTGATPAALTFEDEPYWANFIKLASWAEEQAMPVIWSCLAAHAAVKHLDGVPRHRLPRKLSGVFECHKATDHPLVTGLPSRWRAPHSRYNDLLEADLAAVGYTILSRLASGSPDMFMKRRNSLSLFAQGHLEYDRTTLALEYRRDMGKFLRGEWEERPDIPEGYYDPATERALSAWAVRARHTGGVPDPKPVTPLIEMVGASSWRPAGVRLFANWIAILLEERAMRRTSKLYWATHGIHTPNEMVWRVE